MSELLPYQQRWVDDHSPVKVWDADRQIGSTFAALHEVDERLLSVRVDGDTCQALWIADSDRGISEARRDFTGMTSQVIWSVGVHTRSMGAMGAMLGPLGIVVVDNVSPSADLVQYVALLGRRGVSVRVLASGNQGMMAAWLGVFEHADLHRTTIMDAVREGLGKKVAETSGATWSHAWEFEWLTRLARMFEGHDDSPRFRWY